MNRLNDLAKNTELGSNGRYLVKSRVKETALLASTQIFDGGFTIVVDYGNTKYVKVTDGEKTFSALAKVGEGDASFATLTGSPTDNTALQAEFEGKANIETSSTTGTAVVFTEDKVYGSIATPETGNITADATGGKLGASVLIVHNSGTAPTFDSKFVKLSGSGDYTISVVNYIFCQYINATKIIYSINQEA